MNFEENMRINFKVSSDIWATLYDEQDQSQPAAEIINVSELGFENQLNQQKMLFPNYQNLDNKTSKDYEPESIPIPLSNQHPSDNFKDLLNFEYKRINGTTQPTLNSDKKQTFYFTGGGSATICQENGIFNESQLLYKQLTKQDVISTYRPKIIRYPMDQSSEDAEESSKIKRKRKQEEYVYKREYKIGNKKKKITNGNSSSQLCRMLAKKLEEKGLVDSATRQVLHAQTKHSLYQVVMKQDFKIAMYNILIEERSLISEIFLSKAEFKNKIGSFKDLKALMVYFRLNVKNLSH